MMRLTFIQKKNEYAGKGLIMSRFTTLAIGMILGGVLLIAAGFIMVKGDVTMFNSKNSRYVEKFYDCRDKITDISVTESSGTVVVQAGDVDHVSVSYHDREDDPLYEIEESNGRLSIRRKKNEGIFFFNLDFTRRETVITVPEELSGSLDLKNSSGSIRVKDVAAGEVILKNTSGSIKLEDVTSEGDLSVKNTSGSISLKNTEAGKAVSAENTSGSIKLDDLKSGSDIRLDTSSGSIKGTIVGKESDYRIHASVTSGSCNLKDSDEGDKELNARVTSGSINIRFSE